MAWNARCSLNATGCGPSPIFLQAEGHFRWAAKPFLSDIRMTNAITSRQRSVYKFHLTTGYKR